MNSLKGFIYIFCRDCKYPQELIFRIKEGPVKISSIHLLSHEYKITSRIEFYTGVPKNGESAEKIEDCNFLILGYDNIINNIYIIIL